MARRVFCDQCGKEVAVGAKVFTINIHRPNATPDALNFDFDTLVCLKAKLDAAGV